MSRHYFLSVTVCLAIGLAGASSADGSPQEKKPENPPPAGGEAPSSGGLFSMLFESKLERALKRGLQPGGNVAGELKKLNDDAVESRSDAEAICRALSALLAREAEGIPLPAADFEGLAALFQLVRDGSSPAFQILEPQGLPLLEKLYHRQLERADPARVEHLLTGLQTFAMYGAKATEELILTAIQKKIGMDEFQWEQIFETVLTAPLPSDEFFVRLKQNLPSGQAGLALLSAANSAAVEGELNSHPFDSAAGLNRLRVWLSDRYDSNPAYSAAVALAFVSPEIRGQLLPLAANYPDPQVRMEAGWAAGRHGDEQGLRTLASFCRELEYSKRAQRYLEEIGRGEAIPEEARSPDFRARATFSDWLQHPNELGQAPDEVEVIDRRKLNWPLEEKPGTFWLIRYTLRDETGLEPDGVGVGLVGSMTWCFFDPQMLRRPPEDVYAIHSAWELEQQQLIRVRDRGSDVLSNEMLRLLVKPLEDARLLLSARVAIKLKLPDREYFVAEGKIDGVAGWAVLGESEVAWYPKAEHPETTSAETILRIHLGRMLLGFKDELNRREYLSRQLPRRTPEEIIAAYERLLDDLSESGPEEQAGLLSFSPLDRNFESYLDALVAARGGKREHYLLEKYAEILDLAEDADGPARESCYHAHGLLGEHFDAYAAALIASGDGGNIPLLIERFAPHWQHASGYSRFGNAAYRVGRLDLAEQWFAKMATDYEYRHQEAEMSLLAEIWQRRGEVDKARELLIDCLEKLAAEARAEKFEHALLQATEQYKAHRATYLRLFPAGATELEARGLPENPTGRSGKK